MDNCINVWISELKDAVKDPFFSFSTLPDHLRNLKLFKLAILYERIRFIGSLDGKPLYVLCDTNLNF